MIYSTHRFGFRLYKISIPTGVLMSLPLLLTVVWYSWSAFAQIDRYSRASGVEAPWSLELFQIALHDELTRDLRRTTLKDRPVSEDMPTFSLSLTRESLDGLNQPRKDSGKRGYVKGHVQKDGAINEMKVRYRGTKPWHWLGKQKSMKLRLGRGDLIDGTRIFNLLNDPTPFGMEDQLIFDLARELGLLAPEYHPAWVRLNNNDMGVYRYAAQPTERVLRRGRRIPGNVYSGSSDEIDPRLGVGGLFFSRAGWQQVESRAADHDEEFEPLDRLLDAVQKGSFAGFASFAEETIDLDRYATFDALDVVFGGNEHDYFTNHKLYYDPYRGKFEPLAWSFRGFRHEPHVNLVDNPLLIRLKMTPGYLARRNRIVFELLLGEASVPHVRRRADELFEQMRPHLIADAHWDAYKLLPRVSRFHRFMVRPMSTAKWVLASRAEIQGHSRRVRFLLDCLEMPSASATMYVISPTLARVDVEVNGEGAHRLREVQVSAPCEGEHAWFADVNRDGRLDEADHAVAAAPVGGGSPVAAFEDLYAGMALVRRADPIPKRGTARVVAEPRTYSYHLKTPCAPVGVALVLDNQVTGSSTRLVPVAQSAVEPELPQTLPAADAVPVFAAGQRAPHPWSFEPEPQPEIVELGPALVQLPTTQTFAPHQHVRIVAGTRIELGPEASLIFRGPLTAVGTARQPIEIGRSQPAQPFGGIAIHGPATAGSILKHVRIDGGTRVVGHTGVTYPSFMNIYDTRDITIEAVSFSRITDAGDVLHTTYLEGASLSEIDIAGAPTDGIDLEFSSAELRGIRIAGAGDDCVDLMGSTIRISDSTLAECTNNAVSAGEESDLTAHSLFISHSGVGVLAKNASRVRVARSLIYRTKTAMDNEAAGRPLPGREQDRRQRYVRRRM